MAGSKGDDKEKAKKVEKEFKAGVSKLEKKFMSGALKKAFGANLDLSRVKPHVGSSADVAAKLGAKAFTKGGNIVFGSADDLKSAAHELTHVVQLGAHKALDAAEKEFERGDAVDAAALKTFKANSKALRDEVDALVKEQKAKAKKL